MFYVVDMLLFVFIIKIIYMFFVVLFFVCGGDQRVGRFNIVDLSVYILYIYFFFKYGFYYSIDCVYGICNDVWNWIFYVCNGCY